MRKLHGKSFAPSPHSPQFHEAPAVLFCHSPAVLENEYGASGIDGDRLAGALADGTVNIWEMTEGCICCSAKGDFAASVLTIANAVDPEYLVVEPTGVGMLGQIIQNLRQI